MMKWIIAAAATLAFTAQASAADKVVLMLNWYVYGEHAPFYYGKAKGIYAAEGIDLTKCISALPPPECERKPQHSGDSGGSAQLALFAVMALGLGVIGFVVVRSTRRNTIARRDAAGRAS